ncbi:hypothetical protein ACS0TY_023572 [Phlomoides rotata]
MASKHVLLVTYPGQGHINPSLQFAKRLTKHGVKVTFLTSLSAIRRISQSSSFNNLIEFLSFSHGYDDGWINNDAQNFMSELRIHGSKAVEDAILTRREEGRPFARVIYTLLVPWAGHVAHRLLLPTTLLWIQPAIVFGLYYYYFNNYFDVAKINDGGVIDLPGLPAMESSDLPSFFLDSNPNVYDFALPTFTENFKILDREDDPAVLLNTFDELEPEALKALSKYKLLAIGPLIPSAFLDGHDPTDTSFGGDLIQKTEDYIPWLNSKEISSVIYVAFGSYSELSTPQMEEIAGGLMRTGRPFLWVIRQSKEKIELRCREDLEKQGKIVSWCSQVEVLSHPSVGCFVTHCGWNSTLESLVSGMPVVMLPQWSDQATNAKLMQDYWRTGVRVKGGDGGVVGGDEIRRCVEIVMGGGERGEEMRREGKKWRDLAKGAMKEDGSSNLNLKFFVDQLVGGHA